MRFIYKIGKWAGCLVGLYFISVMPVFAATTAESASPDWHNLLAIGSTITLAVIAGVFGQSKVASTALEAIGRNPSAQNKIFVPMIVALALIESLVIYALVVVFAKM